MAAATPNLISSQTFTALIIL